MIKKVIAGIQKITFYGAVDVALSFPGGLCCTDGFMDNQPTWTDETQANYEAWERAHGNEPPEVKLPKKEESMKKDKIPEGFHEPSGGVAEEMDLMGVPQGIPAADINTNPVHRTRRPKGLPDNVTVETYREATVHVEIPARPNGMSKVKIAIHYHHDTAPLLIDWPEGVTALEALTAHFVVGE